jgi:hypothetical protein
VAIDVFWEEMDWEDETEGPAPTRTLEVVRDSHSLVERFLSGLEGAEFPHLSFISRETFTVFHQQHIVQLITELEALSRQNHDPQIAKHLRAVSQLVFKACGSKDTLIVFRVRKEPRA